MEQPEQEEAKRGLHLWSVTKLRITGVSNIRGIVEVDPDGLEHSLSSFPPNLLCPGEHLNQKEGANCLKLPGKVKESQA